MNDDDALDAAFARLLEIEDEAERAWVVAGLPLPMQRRLMRYWRGFAHDGQHEPEGDWKVWLILAGRGFGKTRAGAEWVTALAREDGTRRFALVGASIDEVDAVMIRGESGLMKVARAEDDVLWFPSVRKLVFQSGAEAYAYSGASPDKLRGPQHHYAWVDELAKYARPEETWDNLMLGLRLGERPRVLVTTTPRSMALLTRIKADAATVLTQGRTRDNPHLSTGFVADMTARYGGTRLGRQELDGEIVEDVEGALWTRALVERCRASPDSPPAVAGPLRKGRDVIHCLWFAGGG